MASFQDILSGVANSLLLGGQPAAEFSQSYRCYSIAHANESLHCLESGDKICLPSSALNALAQRHVQYPMLFEISNLQNPSQKMYCGVMEFSAREGIAYVPHWLMKNIGITDGALVLLRNVTLPKGTFIQLCPHDSKFTMLSDPRVILEKKLRGYSCMTKGSTIAIQYSGFTYLLDVMDVKPADAVSIIEADVEVDFAPPRDAPSSPPPEPVPDSSELVWSPSTEEKNELPSSTNQSQYFSKLGRGHRLSERLAGASDSTENPSPDGKSDEATEERTRIVEDRGQFRYVYELDRSSNRRRLIRRVPLPKTSAFGGKGYSLSKMQ
uniref:Ubiquitin fusion degradation protein 1 homolog n=1 Tax=Hirondellea gigas TaxID=1518452 RepID=A0A6A7FYA0_9CRUS